MFLIEVFYLKVFLRESPINVSLENVISDFSYILKMFPKIFQTINLFSTLLFK